MERRDFIRLCTGVSVMFLAGPQAFGADARPRRYARVLIATADDTPLRAGTLEIGKTYIFHYPFAATPCFLLNLGRPTAAETPLATEDGQRYQWSGGVGPNNAIVAYSAICAHQMAYPTRQVTFIGYTQNQGATGTQTSQGVITCCANYSVYDPAQGAKVLSGPAKQPLAAIMLEYRDNDGALFAVGTFGGEMFHAFFEKFAFRLELEYGPGNAQRPVTGTTTALPLEKFSNTRISC